MSKNKLILDGKEIEIPKEFLNEIAEKVKNSKVSKDKEMSEFLHDQFNGCKIILKDDSIFYKKDKVLFEYDKKNQYFWLSYDKIWSIFEDKFNLSYYETQQFIKEWLEVHLDRKGVTPDTSYYRCWWSWRYI